MKQRHRTTEGAVSTSSCDLLFVDKSPQRCAPLVGHLLGRGLDVRHDCVHDLHSFDPELIGVEWSYVIADLTTIWNDLKRVCDLLRDNFPNSRHLFVIDEFPLDRPCTLASCNNAILCTRFHLADLIAADSHVYGSPVAEPTAGVFYALDTDNNVNWFLTTAPTVAGYDREALEASPSLWLDNRHFAEPGLPSDLPPVATTFGHICNPGGEALICVSRQAVIHNADGVLIGRCILDLLTPPAAGDQSDPARNRTELFETFVRNHLGIVYLRQEHDPAPTFVGGAVREITGYPPEALRSGEVSWESLVFSDDRVRRLDRISDGFVSGLSAIEIEYRIVTADGTIRWVNERIRLSSVEADGARLLEGAIQDISRRILIEQALRSSEAFASAVIEHSPLAIAVHSVTGRLLMVNDAWRSIWRVDDDSLQWLMAQRRQAEALEGIYGHVAEWIPEISEVFEDGGSLYIPEAHMPVPGAQDRWVSHHLYAIRDHLGTVQRVVVITTDITERRHAEKAIRDTTEALQAERQVLQEKNAALKQILDHIEQDKAQYKNELCSTVEHAIMPYLRKMMVSGGRLSERDVAQLESAVRAIVGKDIDEFKVNFDKLSPREAQICDLIRDGLTSKEISEKLNVSLLTVHKHREQIRKKLNLDNRNINLSTYLRSH